MPTYYVTDTAGRKISRKVHNGAGTEIDLTVEQAAYYLRSGEISETPPPPPEDAPSPDDKSPKAKSNVRD